MSKIDLSPIPGLPPDRAAGLYIGWLEDGRTVLLKWVRSFGPPGWLGIAWDNSTPMAKPICYRLDPENPSPPYVVTHSAQLL